ncbi:MAG: SRPBCC family protein [Solirubrobacteraceae bacterium]
MARYRATVETTRDAQEVFAYLSDFSTTAEWDPGVLEAQRLDPEVKLGSRFRLVASFRGRRAEIVYTVVRYEPPWLITLRGENATVVSLDTIEVQPLQAAAGVAAGARVTYDAQLSMKGILRIGDPLLARAFKPVGDNALAGLRRKLGQADGPLIEPRSGSDPGSTATP